MSISLGADLGHPRAGLARSIALVSLSVVIAATGCQNRGSASSLSGTPPTSVALEAISGILPLIPTPNAAVDPTLDLGRLGLSANDIDRVYEYTTPDQQSFGITMISRAENRDQQARIAIAHVRGSQPLGSGVGPVSLADDGIDANGPATHIDGLWLEARGQGFVPLAVRGVITGDETIVVRATTDDDTVYALIQLSIGSPSAITIDIPPLPLAPHWLDSKTVYSSNSWLFGLPAIAASADRATIIAYDGDRDDPVAAQRYELRLQQDFSTDTLSGGGDVDDGLDLAVWRDHELATLYNVLATINSSENDAFVRLSFDAGATFGQTASIAVGGHPIRGAQLAIAADYSIAAVYWQFEFVPESKSTLWLVEGAPTSFDASGSPQSYAFQTPTMIAEYDSYVTPLVMDVEYSSGGDLVIGYGLNHWVELVAQYLCAVRLYGVSTFTNTLVEEFEGLPLDPNIALSGAGVDLEILYAYERPNGIVLRQSLDAGLTFPSVADLGESGAYEPSVLFRDQAGQRRVDVLYLQPTAAGTELRGMHWDDLGVSSGEAYQLTAAWTAPSMFFTGDSPGSPGLPTPSTGVRTSEVSWFGYDATVLGDDVIVVVDEYTWDSALVYEYGFWVPPTPATSGGAPIVAPPFVPASPPPLAPGLTEPVPAADPNHLHQLRLIVLD